MRVRVSWVAAGCVILGLIVLAVALALAGGWESPAARRTASAPAGLRRIDHFIFIIKENRSFDNYFDRYPRRRWRHHRAHLHRPDCAAHGAARPGLPRYRP